MALDLETILVRLVTAMVQETVDMLGEEDAVEKLKLEAYYHRLLAVNCDEKARLADGFAEAFAKEGRARSRAPSGDRPCYATRANHDSQRHDHHDPRATPAVL